MQLGNAERVHLETNASPKAVLEHSVKIKMCLWLHRLEILWVLYLLIPAFLGKDYLNVGFFKINSK